MKRNYKIIIIAILVLSVVILGAQAYLSKNSLGNESLNFVDFPPTPIIDQNINKNFFEQAIDPLPNDLNTGITVERLKMIALNGIPTPSPNYISLLVFNHTDEPIGFENIGFNIKIFQYNSETNIWEKVLLPYTP